MARHVTPNYGWIFADVGGDVDTWGTLHQTAWDAIDTEVAANAAVAAAALPLAGGIMTGQIKLLVSNTTDSGINFGQGVSPTVPVNGDVWVQDDGLYVHVEGQTYLVTVLGHTHNFVDLIGTIATAQIADDAVTLAKQAAGTNDVLQGFDATGDPAEVTIGAGLALAAGVLANTQNPNAVFTEYNLGTYDTSTNPTQVHGLGGFPGDVRAFIKCKSGIQGYSIGDMVAFESFTAEGGANRKPSVYMSETIVGIKMPSGRPELAELNTNDTQQITTASWDVIVRVYP